MDRGSENKAKVGVEQITIRRRTENLRKPRKHTRMRAPLLVGDLADGKNVFQGVVDNFSIGGLKMSDVPAQFAEEKEIYTVIVSTGRHHFRLMVKSCWRIKGAAGNKYQVGFKIVDAPWRWLQMTSSKKNIAGFIEGIEYTA